MCTYTDWINVDVVTLHRAAFIFLLPMRTVERWLTENPRWPQSRVNERGDLIWRLPDVFDVVEERFPGYIYRNMDGITARMATISG